MFKRILAGLGLLTVVNLGVQAAPVASVSSLGVAPQATASAGMFDGMEVDANGDIWLIHSGNGWTAREYIGNIAD